MCRASRPEQGRGSEDQNAIGSMDSEDYAREESKGTETPLGVAERSQLAQLFWEVENPLRLWPI